MNKARPLLLLLPLVMGAFYLRSLASWRPKKLFVGGARISQLAFSSDGRTLLVGQNHLGKSPPRLLSLDAAHGFGARWSYEGRNNFIKPQFFLGDSRVLVREQYTGPIKVLDASAGQLRHNYGTRDAAVISADGKWLASGGYECVYLEPTAEKKHQVDPSGIKIQAARAELISSAPALSPDGRTLIVQVTEVSGTRLDFYDIRSGKKTHSWIDSTSRVFGKGIQWSRNGRYLLSMWSFPTRLSGILSIQMSWSLWRVSDGRKLASTTFPYNEVIPGFEVEDDGRVLSY